MKRGRERADGPNGQVASVLAMNEASRDSSGAERAGRVLLIGNPNSGKTTLFNRLTGSRAKVGNYPGITVECRGARIRGVAAEHMPRPVELIDMPGTYSLTPQAPEEALSIAALMPFAPVKADAVVVTADGASLGRALYLVLQVLELGHRTVLALTMLDELETSGVKVDVGALSATLGVPVVPLSAKTGAGVAALAKTVGDVLQEPPPWRPVSYPITDYLSDLAEGNIFAPLGGALRVVEGVDPVTGADVAPAMESALLGSCVATFMACGHEEMAAFPTPVEKAARQVRAELPAEGRELESRVIRARYGSVDRILEAVAKPVVGHLPRGGRVDAVLLHPLWGTLVLLVVMAGLFHLLFWGAEPMMGAIEGVVSGLQGAVRALLPAGVLRDLVTDGVLAGVGNVVVFVPQIAILFFAIAALEDSGYLARGAFLVDRLMGASGLSGRAFVPMLSGYACAVPAVLATRTLERRRDRLLCMLVIPLTSCSARLPVYVLIAAVVFPPGATIFGGFSLGAFVLFLMYGLSLAATLAAAAVLRKLVLPGPRSPLVLELPPYRWPLFASVVRTTWERIRVFLVDAGTIILAMTVVLWALLAFPQSDEIRADYAAQRDAVVAAGGSATDADRQLAILAERETAEQLAFSFAGRVGKTAEPALEVFGQDWRVGIAILAAFSAREVFVGTLGIIWGIGETDESSASLREQLKEATWPDGRPLFTPLSGAALLVFFLLACQCMSTVAAVRRESGSWFWASFLVVYMSVLAYGSAVLVYQGGLFIGFE